MEKLLYVLGFFERIPLLYQLVIIGAIAIAVVIVAVRFFKKHEQEELENKVIVKKKEVDELDEYFSSMTFGSGAREFGVYQPVLGEVKPKEVEIDTETGLSADFVRRSNEEKKNREEIASKEEMFKKAGKVRIVNPLFGTQDPVKPISSQQSYSHYEDVVLKGMEARQTSMSPEIQQEASTDKVSINNIKENNISDKTTKDASGNTRYTKKKKGKTGGKRR